MKRTMALTLAVSAAITIGGCRKQAPVWYTGGLDAALERAQADNTLVMIEFYADW